MQIGNWRNPYGYISINKFNYYVGLSAIEFFTPKKVHIHDYFRITAHRRKIYIQKRPNLHNFLERIAKLYDIYFFTSSTKGSFVENLAERTSFDLFPCPKNK